MNRYIFVPSSAHLNDMIANAMSKCDGAIEQTKLRDEARDEARAVRWAEQDAAARQHSRSINFWLGADRA